MPSNTTFSQKKNIIKTSDFAIYDYIIDQLSVINIPRHGGVSERLTP